VGIVWEREERDHQEDSGGPGPSWESN